jgi:hypothetical protein
MIAIWNGDSLGALEDLQPESSSQSTTPIDEDKDEKDEDEEYEDEEDEDEEDDDEEDEDEEDEDDGSNEDDDDEEEEDCLTDECKHPKKNNSNEHDLTSVGEERIACDSPRSSHSTPQKRRQADIISSEVSYRIQSLLHPNETSQLPLRTKDRKRHARNHSNKET